MYKFICMHDNDVQNQKMCVAAAAAAAAAYVCFIVYSCSCCYILSGQLENPLMKNGCMCVSGWIYDDDNAVDDGGRDIYMRTTTQKDEIVFQPPR